MYFDDYQVIAQREADRTGILQILDWGGADREVEPSRREMLYPG
jgi:hypothetical protein